MATITEKIQAERDARQMLEDNDISPPDWVEYGYTCIRLYWTEPKVVLIVDIDEPPEGFDDDVADGFGLERLEDEEAGDAMTG